MYINIPVHDQKFLTKFKFISIFIYIYILIYICKYNIFEAETLKKN